MSPLPFCLWVESKFALNVRKIQASSENKYITFAEKYK